MTGSGVAVAGVKILFPVNFSVEHQLRQIFAFYAGVKIVLPKKLIDLFTDNPGKGIHFRPNLPPKA